MALAKRIILVEGPSDELVVQRAFRDAHGRLPLELGVDVISVRGLSFKRFLDIAQPLERTVEVVLDNDGNDPSDMSNARRSLKSPHIRLHLDAGDGHTLEPQLVTSCDSKTLNGLLDTAFPVDAELAEHMLKNKTACALKIFEYRGKLTLPQYIRDAVAG